MIMSHLWNHKIISQNFQKSFKVIAIFANCHGLLPVDGVTSDYANELKFRWVSLKIMYTVTLLVLAGFKIIANILYLFQKYSFSALSK